MQKFVDYLLAELVEEDYQGKNYWKVQFKKQANRSDIVILATKPMSEGAWSQKCQIVVKDGLPSWTASLVMKQVFAEVCGEICPVENIKKRKDEILKSIQDGTWLQRMHDLVDYKNETGKPIVFDLDADAFRFIMALKDELPVPQRPPKPPADATPGQLRRMGHMVAQSSAESLGEVPAPAPVQQTAPRRGELVNPDLAGTLVEPPFEE